MKAIWNDTVIAESDATVIMEGNHYFPAGSIIQDFFIKSKTHTTCHWKGVASYYDLVVADKINKDAAWYYPETSDLAASIKGYVAFWRGVKVIN